METYGRILLIAMPIFLVLVLFEKWYGWRRGFDTVRTMDMISSLTSGITNVTKDVLKLSIGILTYGFLVKHLAIFEIKATWLTYVIAFLVIDFQGYWVHRWCHKINIFWNRHIIHHSSEEFNLACALRQSISGIFDMFAFLLIPAALVGVPKEVIAVVAPLHLFAQFWYHTRHIGKMGWLEQVIVTPSHHRVHHALNPEYLDKNLGQIFIFWDKWFGTFQAELDHVPPVYGITRPAATYNPVKINFQHAWLLLQDAWRTQNWWDKLRIWFMPTGWRPADVAAKYPVFKIEDPYHFEKYNPKAPQGLAAWSWVQLLVLLLFISYLFGNIAAIGSPDMFIYGGFILLSVIAITELMDGNTHAFWWEAGKNAAGLGIILYQQDWFKLSLFWQPAVYGVAFYFIVATLVVAWFSKQMPSTSLKRVEAVKDAATIAH
ncbi:MAG TPA: sterol desaturase family protein [Phnomibacter sp.]|nr:sterol desaturase family protein [Phnomibacter sp.]